MKPLDIARVRHAVIVAPHPDDETIGAYGLIRALRAHAARVEVIMVTNGCGSHRSSARWPAPRLARLRQQETLAALRGLGIGKGAVTFLGLPDGGMTGADRSPLRRAIAQARTCDLLVLPASDDDHPDHRAVAAIARAPVRCLEYLVWPSRTARSRCATHGLRLGALAAAKRAAILRYRSQTGAITDDPNGFAISRAELAAFSQPMERFRELRR